MRSLCIDLTALSAADLPLVGGKARALGRLADTGLPVPPEICLTTFAYAQCLDTTGLRQRLPLLLERKPFQEMRWEELWDLGLRIRNLFLNTPLPERLTAEITAGLPSRLTRTPVTVRSSAPVEDSVTASLAGLYDFFVNFHGLCPLSLTNCAWCGRYSGLTAPCCIARNLVLILQAVLWPLFSKNWFLVIVPVSPSVSSDYHLGHHQ